MVNATQAAGRVAGALSPDQVGNVIGEHQEPGHEGLLALSYLLWRP
jgi:hypothetical protein